MTVARFTLAYWCVLVAALLPIVCAGIAKWGTFGKPRRDGGFDNENPRAWLARQTDWRARANAAQANSFEALPFFIRTPEKPRHSCRGGRGRRQRCRMYFLRMMCA